MSTNVYRTTYQPGEELLNRVAETLAQRQRESREYVDRFVEDNLSRYEERFGGEGRQMCELTGRFEEIREVAPSDLYEEVQADFEKGVDVEKLAERVEMLEREGARRFENREICNMGMAEIARDAGGALESPQWEPGGELISTFHFQDGNRMAASISEGSLGDGATKEIVWFGQTCNTRDCSLQERSIRQVVESKDNMEVSGGMTPAPEPDRAEEPGEREAAGEAG